MAILEVEHPISNSAGGRSTLVSFDGLRLYRTISVMKLELFISSQEIRRAGRMTQSRYYVIAAYPTELVQNVWQKVPKWCAFVAGIVIFSRAQSR